MQSIKKRMLLAAMSAMVFGGTVGAQEITLKAVSAWPEGNQFSRNFEQFIQKVNADGEGIIRINYLGGGEKIIPTFEVGNAVKTGVFDIVNVASSFYSNVVPESNALNLNKSPASAWRTNGALDYINAVWGERMNVRYLARAVDGEQFHIYLKKPITAPSLRGLRMRVVPTYRPFFEALNASAMLTVAPGELFTALERGVVDGYGWPLTGLFDRGLQEQTQYRVEPGFYNNDVGILINLNTWNRLNDSQKDVLNKAALWLENLNAGNDAMWAQEKQRQTAAGIQPITFSAAEAKTFIDTAYDTAWTVLIQLSPQHGPKLRELLSQ